MVPQHVPGLPKSPQLAARMDAITQPAHRDALRIAALAGDEGVTVKQVTEALNAQRAWVGQVLLALEAQGFVQGTPPPGERKPGLPTVYRIQTAAVEQAVAEYAAYILGR